VDQHPAPRRPTSRFGPDRRLTGAIGVLAVIAAAAAVLTDDRGGRVLFSIAALVLGVYAAGDLLFWPRLTASADGLEVRTPSARWALPWAEIDDVRADSRTRHGLRSVTLEISAGDALVVLGRRALGEDPERVAELLRAFRPARPAT
jgi:hypothetical protein